MNNSIKDTATSCFELLQRVILDAFHTQVFYYRPPYENLSNIDQGLRDIMWPDYSNIDPRLTPSKEYGERRFFIIRSNLGFYNLILYLNTEPQPDFISVGPFRSEDFSSDYLSRLIRDLHLSSDSSKLLQNLYEDLPYVNLTGITSVTKELISVYYPEFQDLAPVYVEYADSNNTLQFDPEILDQMSAEYAESYQKALLNFIDTLLKGSLDHALKALHEFLHISRFLYTQNLEKCKMNMHLLNDYCQGALMSTIVHPTYVLKLYSAFRDKIQHADSREAILALPNELCHRYSILVKNYSFSDYSKTIRAVVNHIHLHLDEDLSLSVLAELFHKNASTLSSSFSKEVGISITNYIHQIRIQEAIRYFNSTKMTVSEVALAVGFQDFAYFSRLFHKQIGCSPREYCKAINQTSSKNV